MISITRLTVAAPQLDEHQHRPGVTGSLDNRFFFKSGSIVDRMIRILQEQRKDDILLEECLQYDLDFLTDEFEVLFIGPVTWSLRYVRLLGGS